MTLLPGLDVSRETFARLKAYEELLLKWTKRINLISRNTVEDAWARHILDSAQLFPWAQDRPGPWVDFGSGGGMPGLVLAILAGEFPSSPQVHLVESDTRKAAFLSHVCQELKLSAQVRRERIEEITSFHAGLITARALAPLHDLLALAELFLAADTKLLFLKGAKADSELTAALAHWHIDVEVFESRTDPTGRILRLSNVRRRNV
ncbi:MAG: 16S rRNA (guanine(527)-N(7))-methyltransferase RsmG [Pseudomonadota bacterium]